MNGSRKELELVPPGRCIEDTGMCARGVQEKEAESNNIKDCIMMQVPTSKHYRALSHLDVVEISGGAVLTPKFHALS